MDREWGNLEYTRECYALCLKWARDDVHQQGLHGGESFEREVKYRFDWYFELLATGEIKRRGAA